MTTESDTATNNAIIEALFLELSKSLAGLAVVDVVNDNDGSGAHVIAVGRHGYDESDTLMIRKAPECYTLARGAASPLAAYRTAEHIKSAVEWIVRRDARTATA